MAFELSGRHAVVTGASAGIGAALARVLAARGCVLHLVARRADKLQALARELPAPDGTQHVVHAMDLTDPDAPERLADALAPHPVTVVVNNAGLGLSGPFHTRDPEVIDTLIALNVRFLTRFTRLIIPRLLLTGGPTRLMNVGSVAGYQGVHHFMPYAATKAYVNNFSEGLNWELRGTPLRVTSLEPGSTHSEFFAKAGMEGSFMARFDVMTAEAVAKAGVKALVAGRARIIPGLTNKIKIFSLRLSPRWLVRLSIGWMFKDLHD